MNAKPEMRLGGRAYAGNQGRQPARGANPDERRENSIAKGVVEKSSHGLRMQLVEFGGQIAGELGLSRVHVRILVYLYLSEGEHSLDQIERSLNLSKASVSIAARRMEALGFLIRIRKTGDRRRYYRTVDKIGRVLKDEIRVYLRSKMDTLAQALEEPGRTAGRTDCVRDNDMKFLEDRIRRALASCERIDGLLRNRSPADATK